MKSPARLPQRGPGPRYIESGIFVRPETGHARTGNADGAASGSDVGTAGAEIAPLERLEIELLLEAIYRHHGSDFRTYALPSLRRRLLKRAEAEGVSTITALQERVLHDASAFDRLLADLSIRVTTMFRDPTFFLALRTSIVPILRGRPSIRIWHAGCATGEEVYSLALVLEEEGLLDRTRVYATDMNDDALETARAAVYPVGRMREYTSNYQLAGGRACFSDYYTTCHDRATFTPRLRRNVVFAPHNLATDGPFSEFDLILCRNVLMYFGRGLKDRVLELFTRSLAPKGMLCLGRSESLSFTAAGADYALIHAAGPIYSRIRD